MFNSTEYNTIPINSQTEMFDIPTRIITVLDKGFKRARGIISTIKTPSRIKTINRSNTKVK